MRCEADRDWYNRVSVVAASDDSVMPPAWVLKRAVRIFETQRSKPSVVERIGKAVASLVFDSLARPALAGVRSTETASRQLLYKAGDFSVDLQVVPAEGASVDLIGQVLRESEPGFESVDRLGLDLMRGGEIVCSTSTNEMGEFALAGVDPGVFDMRVRLQEGTIFVPGLPITLP
jgi:hypothetical protein